MVLFLKNRNGGVDRNISVFINNFISYMRVLIIEYMCFTVFQYTCFCQSLPLSFLSHIAGLPQIIFVHRSHSNVGVWTKNLVGNYDGYIL